MSISSVNIQQLWLHCWGLVLGSTLTLLALRKGACHVKYLHLVMSLQHGELATVLLEPVLHQGLVELYLISLHLIRGVGGWKWDILVGTQRHFQPR